MSKSEIRDAVLVAEVALVHAIADGAEVPAPGFPVELADDDQRRSGFRLAEVVVHQRLLRLEVVDVDEETAGLPEGLVPRPSEVQVDRDHHAFDVCRDPLGIEEQRAFPFDPEAEYTIGRGIHVVVHEPVVGRDPAGPVEGGGDDVESERTRARL